MKVVMSCIIFCDTVSTK